MNIVIVIPLVASLLYFLLFVFSLRVKQRANRIFSVYLLAMGLWSFCSFIWHADFPIIGDPRWLQVSFFFAISYVPVLYHFVVTFLGLDTKPIFRGSLWAMYGLLFVALIGDIHGDLIRATRLERGQFDVQFGSLMYPAWVYGSLGITACFVLLTRASIKTRDDRNQRNRLLYLAVSNVLILVGSFVNISPQLRSYPFDHLFNVVAAFLMAYAIYRYQLLDLSLVIRKGLAYSVLTGGLAASYLLTIFVFERLARSILGYGAYLIPILAAVFVAMAFQPLRGRAQTWVDRLFFREKYDAQQMLHRLSRTTASILDLNVLGGMLLEEVTTTMHVAGACILLKGQKTGEFYLAAQRGLGRDVTDLSLGRDHPLPRWMAREGKVLTAHELDIRPQFKALWEEERETLERLSAELFVPLLVKGDLVGLFAFGPKLSEEGYSQDEKITLTTLANQAAIAIENARLYEAAQQEITERKRAEEQIKASLKEKEVLLKEIHHRVKNNLQVISSLLYLQSKDVKDREALEMFQESQYRVRSMALVHERLYQSKDLAKVDLAEYARSLANYLFRSYGVNSNIIELKINVDDVFLGIDTAVPCGLIINELVSNSLKHAFPDGREGEIRIELWSNHDSQFTLMVSDNGVGFPKDLDFRDTQSLGLQLVNTLVDQLEGTIKLDRSGRTSFEITFTELKQGRGDNYVQGADPGC
jgi:two-component sensor histidine kinase